MLTASIDELFSNYGVEKSMGYSFGFGGVNFFFALLAMRSVFLKNSAYIRLTSPRSIDIIGRRRWLLTTLPMMSVFLMASAIAYAVEGTTISERGAQASESIAGIVFIYCEEPVSCIGMYTNSGLSVCCCVLSGSW